MSNTNKKWWTLLATALSCILVGIDYSIVNTCLPNIQLELQASINQLQWVIAGFGLTFSTLLIVMGRLGDLFGHRKILYIGIIGFTLSSLGAGCAQAAWQLIAMRFCQGIFGAMLFPCGISLTSAAFPVNEQGRALGIFGSLIGLGLATGPVLGGVLTHFLNWRWIFFINIPVAVLSLSLCMIFVKESPLQKKVKIDWWGALFLIATLSTLILAISQGLEWGWNSFSILSLFGASIIFFIIFIMIENKTKDPLVPFYFMNNYQFFIGNVVFIVSVSFSWAVIFLVPLYLQSVQGYSVLTTGLTLLLMTIMVTIMPAIAGHWLDKKGMVIMTYIQFFTSIIAFALLMTLQVNTSLVWIIVVFIAAGAAWGMGNGLGMPIALSGLKDPAQAGLVSGATTTILNIFGVLALSIATTIFRFGESKALVNNLAQHNIILLPSQSGIIKSLLSDPERAVTILNQFSHQEATEIITLFHQAFVHGFHLAMFSLLIATVCFFGASIFVLHKSRVNQ